MRKKEQKIIVTFYTTTGAMAMEKRCKEMNIPGRLIPVPPAITAGCGMAWCLPPEAKQSFIDIAQDMDVQGYYEMLI